MEKKIEDGCWLCQLRKIGGLVFLSPPKTEEEVNLQLDLLVSLCPECLLLYFPNEGKKKQN